jgi:integrase
MSLEAARIEAAQTIARLAKGEDVVSQVKAAKRDKVARMVCPSIKEASSDYLDQRPGDASSRYERDVRHLFERQIVPELGASTRCNEVTKAHIRKLIKARKDKGHYVAARNLYAQLRPFFSWCVHEEYITVSPCDGVVAPDVATERQHKLLDAEIVALMSCAIPYYRVLLLTAQRRTEVASMQWCELNLDRREWVIPSSKTKNGREHLVPLSPAVVSILRPLRGERKPSEYVFGKYADAPFSGFSKATRELQADMLAKLREDDAEAEQSDWRIHDLRRTAASGMAALRVQPHIIEAVLNHTVSKLQRTYQVYLYADEKRQALELWADHLAKLCAPKDSNVTPLPLQKRFS